MILSIVWYDTHMGFLSPACGPPPPPGGALTPGTSSPQTINVEIIEAVTYEAAIDRERGSLSGHTRTHTLFLYMLTAKYIAHNLATK